MSSPTTITELLRAWNGGDELALERLIPMVEKELRRLAAREMRSERPNHTLQTTGLVNEAYMLLVKQNDVEWRNRSQFYAIAAQIMRRILVDYSKSRSRMKRGGGGLKAELAGYPVVIASDMEMIIELDDALTRLAEFDPLKSRVVELRHFGGLTVEETAAVLGLAPVTVMRHWSLAKAWLQKEIRSQPDAAELFHTASSGS